MPRRALDSIAVAIYISCMHKTTIYLDDEQYDRVRRLAEATGKTQAAIIREALERMTAPGPVRPRSIGLGRSGRTDLSERAEDLLDGMGSDA